MKTTFEITDYLSRFVIGQSDAKQAIAVAYRERALRLANNGDDWKYVVPNNILMIGPSGTGKTELARQLAELTDAPFVKVEITEFTQVGYYGRDVKTILTDLVNEAIRIAPDIWRQQNSGSGGGELIAFLEQMFLNYKSLMAEHLKRDPATLTFTDVKTAYAGGKFKKFLVPAEHYLNMMLKNNGKKAKRTKVDIDSILEEMGLGFGTSNVSSAESTIYLNFIAICINADSMNNEKHTDFLQTIVPAETYKKLQQRAKGRLNDTKVRGVFMNFPDDQLKTIAEKLGGHHRMYMVDLIKDIKRSAPSSKEVPDDFIVKLVEERGIIFIDEIDKIFVDKSGGNVGNIGVVRDLLPYLDGVTMDVPVKGERESHMFGNRDDRKFRINTANILWIASGAFNIAKVSDVPAEILGRLPVHVSLTPLDVDALYGILNKPHGSVISRLKMIMEAEGLEFSITKDAIMEIAKLAYDCNQRGEDIGARRLINISSVLFDQLRYEASNMPEGSSVVIDQNFVASRHNAILETITPRVERFKKPTTELTILNALANYIKQN